MFWQPGLQFSKAARWLPAAAAAAAAAAAGAAAAAAAGAAAGAAAAAAVEAAVAAAGAAAAAAVEAAVAAAGTAAAGGSCRRGSMAAAALCSRIIYDGMAAVVWLPVTHVFIDEKFSVSRDAGFFTPRKKR